MRLTRIVASAMAAFVTAGALATMTASPSVAQPLPSYPPQAPIVTLSSTTVVVGNAVTIFGQGYGRPADPIEDVDITVTQQSAAAGVPGAAAARRDTGATVAMVPVANQLPTQLVAPLSLRATTNAEGRFQITFEVHQTGVFRIVATGRESGVSSSVLLTVVPRQLPVTGSQLGTQLGVGAGLLLLGVLLVLLTVVRRRRSAARASTA
jgi:hypothetical protein